MTATLSFGLAYNLYLKHDLTRVARAFAEAGIPWLLLKGFALAEAGYGGAAARPMVDNDVVVPPRELERAHRVLLQLGFYDRAGNTLDVSRRADFEHPMHYPHPAVETGLELHWHIYAPELFRGDVAPFFERAVTREVAGLTVLTLNNEDRLVQLATHWVQHGLGERRILTDIARLWNAQHDVRHRVDRRTLVGRLRQVGAHAAFALALLVLQRQGRLSVPVPEGLTTRRAGLFSQVFERQLGRALESESGALDTAEAHRLRLASWLLLVPERALASARRELLPSDARLTRIAGRELSGFDALTHLAKRQLRAVRKIARG